MVNWRFFHRNYHRKVWRSDPTCWFATQSTCVISGTLSRRVYSILSLIREPLTISTHDSPTHHELNYPFSPSSPIRKGLWDRGLGFWTVSTHNSDSQVIKTWGEHVLTIGEGACSTRKCSTYCAIKGRLEIAACSNSICLHRSKLTQMKAPINVHMSSRAHLHPPWRCVHTRMGSLNYTSMQAFLTLVG